ncbi:GspMb/PilO family protein [Zoogloea sp.]|uniref:GspMb/PilO family protein n=1 Tax=Zoogloea sp. TaxID=49181 RepID=UPI0035AFF709
MSARARILLADVQESAGRAFRRAGWAGVLGFALLVCALSFDYSGNHALEAEVESLGQEAQALARRLHQPARPQASARQRLEAFYAGFPVGTTLPDLLVRLHGHAQARGVALERADYRTAAEAGTPLERVTLDLPARGSYPVLRAWLDDLVAEMPELALESVSLRRERIDEPQLEARVQLAFFLRRAP